MIFYHFAQESMDCRLGLALLPRLLYLGSKPRGLNPIRNTKKKRYFTITALRVDDHEHAILMSVVIS